MNKMVPTSKELKMLNLKGQPKYIKYALYMVVTPKWPKINIFIVSTEKAAEFAIYIKISQ